MFSFTFTNLTAIDLYDIRQMSTMYYKVRNHQDVDYFEVFHFASLNPFAAVPNGNMDSFRMPSNK
jgi:hypothetical protein